MRKIIRNFLFRSKLFQLIWFKRKKPINTKIIVFQNNKHKQIIDMINNITIQVYTEKRFQHWLDTDIFMINKNVMIGNVPPNYNKIIHFSLDELIKKESNKYTKSMLISISKYIDKIISELKKIPQNEKTYDSIKYFESMKNSSAINLEDALQRILFWSSLFWQSGHKLVGLGRLDLLLGKYEDDFSEEESIDILKDFLFELHEYYEFKSAALLGDIGQIIILGGENSDGTYFSNKLTYYFVEAVKQSALSDPKLLLRVSSNTPKNLIKKSIECVATGVGSPLFSNDDVVVPKLIEFGYDKKDAYNYVTSACWEPVSYGNSLEQNNLSNINFAKSFSDVLKNSNVLTVECFDEFINQYTEQIKRDVSSCLFKISSIKWESDPLFSYFTDNCKSNQKDIACGGAKYNNYGLLSVGMSNTINSLLNIKKFVFDEKRITLEELHNQWLNNSNYNFKLEENYFGHDNEDAINLTNSILECVKDTLKEYRNPLNGKVKFGLSSPGYVSEGESTGPTFDTRKTGMPLGVHISANDNVSYTELISFASQLNYSSYGSNGNVVDFFVSPNFIESNLEKFTQFIILSIKKGFFQMQMNVVSSETLLKAKENPELFPNLIVRVWGFSAYFNDLPEEYQDVLIERAKISEGLA